MILLVLGASILIAGVTVIQYKNESEAYHRERLERKEQAIRENLKYVLESTTHVVNTQNLPVILNEKDKIYEISQVHDMQLHIYDLQGRLLIKSNETFFRDTTHTQIPLRILTQLEASTNKRYLHKSEINNQKFQSSYTYLNDNQFKPLAILYLPYLQDDELLQKDLNDFLMKLGEVYLFMLLLAILLSYFLSKYITKSLKIVSDKIIETRLDKRNHKIEIDNASEEIYALVAAYNSMIDELEESAVKLATGERERAWREMAKQVHMRLKILLLLCG